MKRERHQEVETLGHNLIMDDTNVRMAAVRYERGG